MSRNALLEKLTATVKACFPEDGKREGAASPGEDGPRWLSYVAMLTGALAALAGFLAVRSTTLTNDAIYESNQAVLAQTQASDAWAEYQADSIKARILETQLTAAPDMAPASRAELAKQDDEIRSRQPKAKQEAMGKSAERDGHLQEGRKSLAEKDLLNYANLAAQLGIALASVAALSRRRSAFVVGVLAGLIGVGITAYVFIVHYLVQL